MTTTLAGSKRTRAGSQAVAAAAEARARKAPLVVKDISPGKLIQVRPEQFALLDVDPAYQRGETTMVNEIVRALQAGGRVFDPVTLCQRPWDSDKNKMWIVDGHQRVCAYQALGLPFAAMLHTSASLQAEKELFLVLNSRRGISSNLIVKAWPGASGELIRRALSRPDSALYQRIDLSQGNNYARIPASTLVRSTLLVSSGLTGGSVGRIHEMLSRLDTALADRAEAERATMFLELVGLIFTKGSANQWVLLSLAMVAREHWTTTGVLLPGQRELDKLRSINWEREVPLMSKKYQPIILQTLRTVWK